MSESKLIGWMIVAFFFGMSLGVNGAVIAMSFLLSRATEEVWRLQQVIHDLSHEIAGDALADAAEAVADAAETEDVTS